MWRHLDTCQFQTHLHAAIPRVQCPTHGVKQVRVPWAEPRSRFTLLLERLVIDLILQCSTVKGACAIAGISWDEAWGIMQRAVVRGQTRKEARPIAYVGVDEKAFRKGHRAWAIKEALRTLWTYRQPAAVKRFFTRWYAWAVRSRLEPVKQVAATLKRHLDGVLRFAKHPITNGVAEGLNSKIMSIKRKAGGFRNPSNFTTAIYFHCGGLDLYPR
jgi:transposase